MAAEPAVTRSSADALAADSRRWLDELRAKGRVRDDAVARLHELLLRAAL